jgi:extracellular elastinolytic metalloproteinase
LTGGPANSNCLGFGESGGMVRSSMLCLTLQGEGYGDFFATVLRLKESDTRDTVYAMGSYAAGSAKGIRKYRYATDMKINPSTYGFIRKFPYFGVHAKGEVWAVILYEALWNLIDQHGLSKDLYSNSTRTFFNLLLLMMQKREREEM